MATFYTTRFVIASLKNVPSMGRQVAHDNGIHGQNQHGDHYGVTETWDIAVKQGYQAGCGQHIDWLSPRRESPMLGTNTLTWDIEDQGVIEGGAAPAIKGVCDSRPVLWRRVRNRTTKRKLVVIATHTAPIPTLKAPWMIPAARRSHQLAKHTIENIAGNTGFPVAALADWNTKRALTDCDVIAGNNIGNGIAHGEFFHGNIAHVVSAVARGFRQESDHPGVTIDVKVGR